MKLKYMNWIYLTRSDALWQRGDLSVEVVERRREVAAAVRGAIARLNPSERLIIEKHYFDGRTFEQIGEEVGKHSFTVINIHSRALRKLRKFLAGFAKVHYGIDAAQGNCPLCTDPRWRDIEELIASKRKEETYVRIIQTLKKQFAFVHISPQTIIGHERYHFQKEE